MLLQSSWEFGSLVAGPGQPGRKADSSVRRLGSLHAIIIQYYPFMSPHLTTRINALDLPLLSEFSLMLSAILNNGKQAMALFRWHTSYIQLPLLGYASLCLPACRRRIVARYQSGTWQVCRCCWKLDTWFFSVAPRVFTRLEAAGKESVQSGFTAAIAGMQCVNAMFESV